MRGFLSSAHHAIPVLLADGESLVYPPDSLQAAALSKSAFYAADWSGITVEEIEEIQEKEVQEYLNQL